ncbi:MAG TPA: TRAFs-binding domain-containing protein, partial [Terriglobales bacterium]
MPQTHDINPVVRYAVSRRIAGQPDYWDYATLLELEVLANREDRAMSALANALASVREAWQPETTANNIRLIRTVRAGRSDLQPWI